VLVLQGAQHSAQIFSLAMLLSSIFVYNQVGAIDAIAIERLAMVCELAKRIKDRSTVTGERGHASTAAAAEAQKVLCRACVQVAAAERP
jgi:hypothetical protein